MTGRAGRLSPELEYRGDGERVLHHGGVRLDRVADEVGTPFYSYSGGALAAALEEWRNAFAAAGFEGDRHRCCFAVKANGSLAVLRRLEERGAGFDIVSHGELHRVTAAGADPKLVVFSGPGKTTGELRAALDAGVGLINIEAPEEIDRLLAEAGPREGPVDVGLRLNPDLEPRTHPFIATGPGRTKFGLAADELLRAVDAVLECDRLRLRAIAAHIGSQITEVEPLVAAAEELCDVGLELRSRGAPVEWLDIGGGLGIPYGDDDDVPTPAELAGALEAALARWPAGLITEPGRVIAGPAGVLVAGVTAVRRREDRDLVICDAGMNALLRPALYQAVHRVVPVVDGSGEVALGGTAGPRRAVGDGSPPPCDVVGPLCEAGDLLVPDAPLSDVRVGDRLAVLDVGAYGFVMSSEYNARPRPAEVWVEDGRYAVVRRRARPREMVRGERADPWARGLEG